MCNGQGSKRLQLWRTLLGLSQEQLGAELNVTFQQVQKYERGANRISASRLWDMSQILDVPVSYFFDDMSETTMRSSPSDAPRLSAPSPCGLIGRCILFVGERRLRVSMRLKASAPAGSPERNR